MSETSFAERAEKYRKLKDRKGIQAVAHWKLPNSDLRFNDEEKAKEYAADVEDHVDLVLSATEIIETEK